MQDDDHKTRTVTITTRLEHVAIAAAFWLCLWLIYRFVL